MDFSFRAAPSPQVARDPGTDWGDQGALALSAGNRWLFVVNAGSNEVSVFRVEPSGLILVDRQPSGGSRPVSLTVDRNLLYVLNAGRAVGGTDTITALLVGPDGTLAPLQVRHAF
jgi:6-phosphogluconolactonase